MLWFVRNSAKLAGRKGCVCVCAGKGVPQEERHKSQSEVQEFGRGQFFWKWCAAEASGSAFRAPGLSINVVRRRIDDFERQIGATLFTATSIGNARPTKARWSSQRSNAWSPSFDLLCASNSVTIRSRAKSEVAYRRPGTFWLALAW